MSERIDLNVVFVDGFRSVDRDSELESSTLELDQSFQRLLAEKRGMTNKENNPPPHAAVHSVGVPEKPMRKDLLRERVMEKMHIDSMNASASLHSAIDSSSYVFQNTSSNDEEYAAINRLMANWNIEYETTNIGPARPSTIAEESTIRSSSDARSIHIIASSSQSTSSTASTSSISSVVKAERHANVLRELKTDDTKNVNTDDTLEEIEYVRTETGLNYVPKKRTHTVSETEEKTDNEVILIESSPECSFETMRNPINLTSAESTQYSFYTAKADFTAKSKDNEQSDISVDERCSDDRTESTAPTLCQNDTDDIESQQKQQTQTPHRVNDESIGSDCDTLSEMPEFNNTLERIEYMMEQGQKMLKRAGGMAAIKTPTIPKSPAPLPRTPNARNSNKKATPLAHSERKMTPAKKLPFKASPAVKTDPFKRPEHRVWSPATTASGSKIPKPKSNIPMSSTMKPQFRHIASPIAAYINNTPEIPLMKTVKPMKNLFDSSYFNKIVNTQHDESTTSVESFPVKSALPRKFCNAAPQRKVCHNHASM